MIRKTLIILLVINFLVFLITGILMPAGGLNSESTSYSPILEAILFISMGIMLTCTILILVIEYLNR